MKEIFKKYNEEALKSYDANFFSRENVLFYAQKAGLSNENKEKLSEFMGYANEDLKHFMWQFYYVQFNTSEVFFKDIWQLERLELPKEAEELYPGYIKAVVYLLAAENLKKWSKDTEFDEAQLLERYFERYRHVVSLNLMTHETFGFCRLSPFMYCYAKPFTLRIGRLNFQLVTFKEYCELYENEKGKRLFVAVSDFTYNSKGLQAVEGFVPVYKCENNKLLAHTFGEKGRLSIEPQEIDLISYKKILSPGDVVVTIHIPEGGPLYIDEVKQSIADAKQILKKYFPPFKAFVCQTWFIDPGLQGEVIKDGSNMSAFANLFDVISGADNDNHSIFEHVFKVKRQPLEQLVPKNDFQKRLLDRALRGEKMYWGYGVLKK